MLDPAGATIEHAVAVWNSHADMIDAKFGPGFLGLRIARPSADRFYFRRDMAPDDPRQTNVVPLGVMSKRETDGKHWDAVDAEVAWRAVTALDDLSINTLIFPEAWPGTFVWMRDFIFEFARSLKKRDTIHV